MYPCVYVCVYTYRKRTHSQTLSHAGKRPFLNRHIRTLSVPQLISQNPQPMDADIAGDDAAEVPLALAVPSNDHKEALWKCAHFDFYNMDV
ncbi:hypothetical protein XELAEV_18042631mg [Xenopus laevis]|uniref:Uncharacterized protein n=1 Tax=Xenopus laevis TaxID=8355 RepID=A0A974C435_XENLA|nr:hypothetical protein XELAEV_18042631mg [Xenopus laevis]